MVLEEISMPTAACHAKTPWHLSFTITCERNRVHDSHDSFRDSTSEAASPLVVIGQDLKEGELVRIPVRIAIWGDTRIEFYLHKGGKKKRKLAFFVCFHTSFYDGERELSFLKNKVDKLCKNPSVPPDFELKLRLSQDPAHEHLEPEVTFRKLFQENGRLVTYKKHDVVLHERNAPDVLRLIVAGSVQGLVHEMSDKTHNYHPLGCVIPFPERCRNAEGAARFPAIVMLGEGHVLGASQFLSGFGNMEFLARSASVQVLELSKRSSCGQGARGSESPNTLASMASCHGSLDAVTRRSTELNKHNSCGMGGYKLRNNVSPAALLRESSRATASMVSARGPADSRGSDELRDRRGSQELVHANGVGPTNAARSENDRKSQSEEKARKAQSPLRAGRAAVKHSASIELSRRHVCAHNMVGEEEDDDISSGSGSGHQGFNKVGKHEHINKSPLHGDFSILG
jgi:hypothetical protein